jgi:hypothetical protein
MTENFAKIVTPKLNNTDILKSWMMVMLTFIFVLLYATALFGWLKPLTDITMVTRLEPIIFVIIGYYFGRLPAQHNEKTLKEEINRQTQKADAAHHSKVQIHLERESLEERIKNAKTVLVSHPHLLHVQPLDRSLKTYQPETTNLSSDQLITAAVSILNS